MYLSKKKKFHSSFFCFFLKIDFVNNSERVIIEYSQIFFSRHAYVRLDSWYVRANVIKSLCRTVGAMCIQSHCITSKSDYKK